MLTKSELGKFRTVALARRVRHTLGLSQSAFSNAFGIPLGTLRDWEQHRAKPDQTARAYLPIIAADPAAVRKLRAKEPA